MSLLVDQFALGQIPDLDFADVVVPVQVQADRGQSVAGGTIGDPGDPPAMAPEDQRLFPRDPS